MVKNPWTGYKDKVSVKMLKLLENHVKIKTIEGYFSFFYPLILGLLTILTKKWFN